MTHEGNHTETHPHSAMAGLGGRPENDPDRPRSWSLPRQIYASDMTPQMRGKMGNLVTDYRKARALLRLGPYDAWLVECIVNLLIRHDNRVAAEKRLRIGRRKSALMRARQDAGRRVSSVPPYGWAVDPVGPWRLTPQPEEQQVVQRILREAAAGKTLRAVGQTHGNPRHPPRDRTIPSIPVLDGTTTPRPQSSPFHCPRASLSGK